MSRMYERLYAAILACCSAALRAADFPRHTVTRYRMRLGRAVVPHCVRQEFTRHTVTRYRIGSASAVVPHCVRQEFSRHTVTRYRSASFPAAPGLFTP